ncbi:hypothetical protein SKAU_G00279840 [Synaphobranchus kaupii]|uniref:Uncharacterized protein n=1 Tax=Synaphobranchus kaupii TaxID=118154 RepID=A0A9Q1INX0_SYNKA|nr:hypothetical protein SKAU_G00279840 [Synaphobranchus kaupii]
MCSGANDKGYLIHTGIQLLHFSIFDGAADIEMAYKQKKHRAMGDEEWMSRLRTFAALGVWPSEAGNRPAPRQKNDTTTRTLILFSITRSNIWTDSNTWANTFQAHFDVGIVYKATVRPSGPSAVTTSSASALPLPTTLTTTVSAAAATAASGVHTITPAAPQQQLYKHTAMPSGPSAVTTSSTSALPLPTTLPATATTARPPGPPSMTPAAPEQQLFPGNGQSGQPGRALGGAED